MQGTEGRWRQSRRRSKHEVFGSDLHDFHFFVFIYVFIFFLAGLVLFAAGANTVVINLEYMDFLGKNYQALVMLTIVLGGTIILTSIMGVVSIYHNKKSMINSFHLVMIFLILAQGVLFIQGIFHVTSYEVGLERRLWSTL